MLFDEIVKCWKMHTNTQWNKLCIWVTSETQQKRLEYLYWRGLRTAVTIGVHSVRIHRPVTQTSQSNPIALHYAVVCALWSFTVTARDVLTIMHWFSEHFMHINITYKKCTLVTCFHSNLTNLSCSSNGYTSRHILHWHMHDKTIL